MAIKCHSGFVHYNMFHNRCCHGGGNNYGSIFNITNNCNGGHTSFWGGFGAGLGFGIGGWLGGLCSNFMGGFGMGGFGMGNFGFGGWGNGLAGLWGGSNRGGSVDRDYSEYSSRRPERSSYDDVKKDVKDKDYPDLNKIHEDVNKILSETPSDERNKKADDLIAKLNQLKDNKVNPNLDGINDDNNKDQIDNLIKTLETSKKDVAQAPVVIPDKEVTDETVSSVDNKPKEYGNYENVALSELGGKTKQEAIENFRTKLKNIIDTSDVDDFVNLKVEHIEIDEKDVHKIGDKYIVTIFKLKNYVSQKDNTKKYNETYKLYNGGTQNEKGEIIFISQNREHQYALQKQNNLYALNQYPWHTGHGEGTTDSDDKKKQ